MVIGSVIVVLAVNYGQTVIPEETKAEELKACLGSSPVWWHVIKLHTTVNSRVLHTEDRSARLFSAKNLSTGNEKLTHTPQLQPHWLPCRPACPAWHD